MYYLKCRHCNHLNEVKSEYLVVCGLCNRKLEDNFKDWQPRHPDGTFDDFKREVCLTGEQVHKGEVSGAPKKKGNRKGAIAGWIVALLVIALVVVIGRGFIKTYDTTHGEATGQASEQQWYTGTYAGGVSLTTPGALKASGSMTDGLPGNVRSIVKNMEGYSYAGNGIDFMFLFTEYLPEAGQADLDEAAAGSLEQIKNRRGVFDLKSDKAYVQEADMSGIVMQGTYVKGGTEYEFNITLYTDGTKLYQLFSSNKKGDDTARGIVRRVYDSFSVAGHENTKTE